MSTITPEEREQIYREKEKEYALQDAEKHLLEFFNFDEESDESDLFCAEFELKTGFSLAEAIDPDSANYILDNLVDAYFDARDCNIAENDTWYNVIRETFNY